MHQIQTHPSSPSAARSGTRRSLLLAAALFVLVAATGSDSWAASRLIGQPAPDFALRSMTSENLRLSEHLGEVVVINFWATWCGPCRQEMPLLDELYSKYKLAGMTLLSVNVDETSERATEMARTLKVSYPVLFDKRQEVSRAYEVGSMPVTVMIDREGVVRQVFEGFRPGYEKRYAEQLRELLNQ
ncbi:MAG TPA: TlpA disulfide reductase family protein [Povalibacter sp.]|nr:TlpA disulfide reductase family protein [Povalibacter sp.]